MVEGVAMTPGTVPRLHEVIGRVRPVDITWRERAEARLNELTKPPRIWAVSSGSRRGCARSRRS